MAYPTAIHRHILPNFTINKCHVQFPAANQLMAHINPRRLLQISTLKCHTAFFINTPNWPQNRVWSSPTRWPLSPEKQIIPMEILYAMLTQFCCAIKRQMNWISHHTKQNVSLVVLHSIHLQHGKLVLENTNHNALCSHIAQNCTCK